MCKEGKNKAGGKVKSGNKSNGSSQSNSGKSVYIEGRDQTIVKKGVGDTGPKNPKKSD